MRPLIIDDAVKARVKAVVEYATQPENHYEPGVSPQPPGDDARHVVLIDVGFRCVFSITKVHGHLFRHMSISVDSKNYPNPLAAYTIAELFGFTGWDGKSEEPPSDWLCNANKEEHCAVLAQVL